MNYQKLTYQNKLAKLSDHNKTSARLAEVLGVSRMSLVNWRDHDANIRDENKLKIDIAYCKAFAFEDISAKYIVDLQKKLADTDFSYFQFTEPEILTNASRIIGSGSLEIETTTKEGLYNQVINDDSTLNKITKKEFLEIHNLNQLTSKVIKDSLSEEIDLITSSSIKNWHYALMQGIRDDAGVFSEKIRIIPGTEIVLTAPEDIEEELEYWSSVYKRCGSMFDIARAHAHFELIHPFGDGNGRLGRLIMAAQCIKIGLIPPLINNKNKALYYVLLEHAQHAGDENPLATFLIESIFNLHEKIMRKESALSKIFKKNSKK